MGGSSLPAKRPAPKNGGLSSRARRKKFRAVGVHTVQRADLSQAQRGVLVSCTPGHEQHAFRDAVVLLSRFLQAPPGAGARAQAAGQQPGGDGADKAGGAHHAGGRSLEKELDELRRRGTDDKVFTRVMADVKGAVFLRVNDQSADLEHVVEHALREARETGNAGSRHCIRVLPIYGTCYAKVETATSAALTVVKAHFPSVERPGAVSYAIVFRARLNNSAKREAFIDAIAAAIHEYEPRYKVNLTTPDVVLIVEVLKTSCCIGTFRKYYELAKMNLREAACPSKPTEGKQEVANRAQGGEEESGATKAVGGESCDKIADNVGDDGAGAMSDKVAEQVSQGVEDADLATGRRDVKGSVNEETVDGDEAKAVEAKAVEAKAVEAKAVEAKAAEAKAAEAKAAEAKAAEAKTAEAKTAEAKAANAAHRDQAKAAEALGGDEAKTTRAKGARGDALEAVGRDGAKAAEAKTVALKAAEAKTVALKAAEAKGAEAVDGDQTKCAEARDGDHVNGAQAKQ